MRSPIDQVAVITGASSGIGKAAAIELLREGWHVIATGRDPDRCAAAEKELRAIPGARVDFVRGDFAEMADVRRVAREIASLTARVHVLVNNAGGIRDGLYTSSEGLEATFAANHLAPFLLTSELLPLLEAAARDSSPETVRVIAVSSLAHEQCPSMNWDDLMLTANFSAGHAYCQAKLANLLFTRELDRRVAASGIVAQAMHPGKVGSNFSSHGEATLQAYMASQDLLPPEEAARTIIWLATAPEGGRPGGRYFHDLTEVPAAPQALNDEAATRLWAESERILNQL
ncbi:SDR family NAD(P)-dependent oxidoreductase [Novosphingobium panipatense]|jgi:NAD(P)-dependent dehydrogenase (short-subunit alcohol dehydrogenase family)|uniref:SDR family NAD(P)-dependent oxidoreductase n=1 Tax=Novosphingobium TaxID=165696 RepID=UPI000CDAEA3F|nr:SDR family NAD(P)-dependent oxidoreductase [Novosphingobium sp. HII-3]